MSATEFDAERFNPFAYEVQQCPFPHYAAIRQDHPVFHVPGTDLYLVTRHEMVVPILRDVETYSNNFGNTGEKPPEHLLEELKAIQAQGYEQVPTMLTIDPPAHTRYRSLVASALTPRRVKELEPVVRGICEELVDAFPSDGRVEFNRAFAIPVPVRAIAHVLNVPHDRLDDFKRWSDDSIASIGAMPSDERRLEAQRGIVEFQQYFAAELEQRRAHPVDDLLSTLVQAEYQDDAGPRPLTMPEMLSIIQQLLVAGNETTTNTFAEAMKLLADHPDQWERTRKDPSRIPTLVEEVLRLTTPTQGMFRKLTRDVVLEGVPIPAGARLVLVYAAANRDPQVFEDPDRFDPDRPNLKEQLAFGKGIHFCIGAPLSRLELVVGLEVLAARVERIELAEDGAPLEYHPSFMLRGLKRVDLQLTYAS